MMQGSKMHKYFFYLLLNFGILTAISNSYSSENNSILINKLNIPYPLYGVTVDSIDDIDATVAALAKLPVKPITRIVFDPHVDAIKYKEAVEKIGQVSYVMGQILDSCGFSKYSLHEYKKRVKGYLHLLGDDVHIWEIGNEVNGEWLGNVDDVRKKVIAGYGLAKKQNQRVALTLYYNEGSAPSPKNEIFTWAEKNIPERMKQGLDYVFISYHIDDFSGPTPDWYQVFSRLQQMFPKAKIGFGELGNRDEGEKAIAIQRFYTLRINLPNYVGGYFWWYFLQDMVPDTKKLWTVLADAMLEQKNRLTIPGETSYPAFAKGLKNVIWGREGIYKTDPSFNLLTLHSPSGSAKATSAKGFVESCGGTETEAKPDPWNPW